MNKKNGHIQPHIALALAFPVYTLRNNRTIFSIFVIEEPSGLVGDDLDSGRLSVLHGRVDEKEGATENRKHELEVLLIKLQKTSKVSGRLYWPEHSSDVSASVQQISLQGSVSIHANYMGESVYLGRCLTLSHLWMRVMQPFIPSLPPYIPGANKSANYVS